MKKLYYLLAIVLFGLICMWCYGNFMIYGDITRAHEFIGRGYGIAVSVAQDADENRLTSYSDLDLPECGKIDSFWCGYYITIKLGIRIKNSGKNEVIAVLLPTKALPFWYWGNKIPPAIVLHGSLGSYQVNIHDVPLKL